MYSYRAQIQRVWHEFTDVESYTSQTCTGHEQADQTQSTYYEMDTALTLQFLYLLTEAIELTQIASDNSQHAYGSIEFLRNMATFCYH